MMNFDPEKIQRRVEGMSEGEMLEWLGAALPGMQRHLEMYQRTRKKEHLGELAIAEMTANFVVTELMSRLFPAVVEEARPAPGAPSEPQKDTGTTSAQRRFLRPRRAKTGTVHALSADTGRLEETERMDAHAEFLGD